MKNPERFRRILAAIGDCNAHGFDRVRHAESIYAMCEESMLSAASGDLDGAAPSAPQPGFALVAPSTEGEA